MRVLKVMACVFLLPFYMAAQEYQLNTENWKINAQSYVIENFEGKRSIYLYRGDASPIGLEFITGIIEFDIYVTDRRGFAGIHFRIQDDKNYEEFYVRPHQSGNPDANQYTPVFNGLGAWQLYYGERYGKAYSYKMNAWNHFKMVVAKSSAELYVNDMDEPLYFIPELKHTPQAGAVSLRNSGPDPFHLADLKVTKIENPVLKSKASPKVIIPEGTIKEWSVSNSFPESDIAKVLILNKKVMSGLKWNSLGIEDMGYANLARVAVIDRATGANTVFAKVTIVSDKAQIKKLSYGFSDRVRVYLNNKILAAGQDNYASRDYRFLGTMGYFDDVYLELKKGNNELWMAVSETFGGWGIMGKFDDLSGIELRD